MNRRAFFEQLGRWFSALLLALLGGYLILEREVGPPASCGVNSLCGQCRQFSGCERPEAVDYRSSPGHAETPAKNQGYGKR